MKITDLHTLLVHELKDLYNAEQQLLETLPKMAKAAANPELAAAFTAHLGETRGHVKRLEQVFKHFDYEPGGQHCNAMEGLVKEGAELIAEDMPDDVKDAALIAAAQRVEHYEIAGYGVASCFASQLGLKEVANLLQQTLDEEGAADRKLSRLATYSINFQAMNG